MDIAKLSAKGQVTIPIDVRRKLGLRAGSKVVFLEQDNHFLLLGKNTKNTENSSKNWSAAFLSAFSQFGETADETFAAPREISPEYNIKRKKFA